ncbi:MAG: 4Fe-4S binding protein [Nitrospirae bacterium]|nr:4Fe-4S binding protein [Nitrospirota bacterium]
MTEDKAVPVTMKDVQAKADEKKCVAAQLLVFIEEFLAEPMCGRCFPCSFGSYEARIRAKRLTAGTASAEDVERLKRIGGNMLEASMCKKGKDTAAYILEKIATGDLLEHLSGLCASRECVDFDKYIIIPGKCTMCGLCLDVCKDSAIKGEKREAYRTGYLPFEIIQKRCTKCGECVKVCPENAILVISAREMENKDAPVTK